MKNAAAANAGAQPEVVLRQTGDQGSQEAADIDPDIENGESGIEPRAALRIQVGNDGADIGLEQPHPKHDHHQADIEFSRARGHGQQGVAEGDGQTAGKYGALRTDQTVGNPAAGQRRQIHGRGV